MTRSRNSSCVRAAFLALLAAIPTVIGCAQKRIVPSAAELEKTKAAYEVRTADALQTAKQRLLQRFEREYADYAAGRTAEPPGIDILILSGGGDYGAFGAGVLKGWGSARSPVVARPEFDVVTGISTGALIAPFAFVGTDQAYDRIVELYDNPKPDWVRMNGLFFLSPANPSLLNISGLERDLRAAVDRQVIEAVAAGAATGRLLAVGASNLDYSEQRVWDVGTEAELALRDNDLNRVIQILLASSAIPGAFPPRIIDQQLYCDGGVTSNILYNPDISAPSSVLSMWRKTYPDRPIPRQRIWVIVSNQLRPPPTIVQPSWTDVAGSAVSVMIRSITAIAIRQLISEAAYVSSTTGAQIEVRFLAIPDDWVPPVQGTFKKETMNSLAQLGAKLGADPASWKSGFEPRK